MNSVTFPNSRRTSAQRQGDAAENVALRHLQAQGLRLIARNVRYRCGELDLVMWDGQILVFVEVRYRTPSSYGTAADSIGRKKQAKIMRAASLWLQAQRYTAMPNCRFDAVTVDGDGLCWHPNAFLA